MPRSEDCYYKLYLHLQDLRAVWHLLDVSLVPCCPRGGGQDSDTGHLLLTGDKTRTWVWWWSLDRTGRCCQRAARSAALELCPKQAHSATEQLLNSWQLYSRLFCIWFLTALLELVHRSERCTQTLPKGSSQPRSGCGCLFLKGYDWSDRNVWVSEDRHAWISMETYTGIFPVSVGSDHCIL